VVQNYGYASTQGSKDFLIDGRGTVLANRAGPVQTQHERRVAVAADALAGVNQTQTCVNLQLQLCLGSSSQVHMCLTQTVASDQVGMSRQQLQLATRS
jgi:hypothetical protein